MFLMHEKNWISLFNVTKFMTLLNFIKELDLSECSNFFIIINYS